MFGYYINYEKYNLLSKNIIVHQNKRIPLEVIRFHEPIEAIPHNNNTVHEYPGAAKPTVRKKNMEKEATKLGIPCTIPTTYAFFGG